MVTTPGYQYGTPIAVTVSDTVNNLRMDQVGAGWLHNRGTEQVSAIIAMPATGVRVALAIPAGAVLPLPNGAQRVMDTGTTAGADLVAFF